MRPKPSKFPTHRYPGLYGSPSRDSLELASGGAGFPFEHRDGWFGVIDALSEVLVWRAEVEGKPMRRVQQVKEKFGVLRLYFGDGDADDGATDMAEEMTTRLCEVSGRPGRLGKRRGGPTVLAPTERGATTGVLRCRRAGSIWSMASCGGSRIGRMLRVGQSDPWVTTA